MIVEMLACLLLVLGVTFGLSRPLMERLKLAPSESLVGGAALSLLGAWLVAWVVFISGSPLSLYGLIPAAALASLLFTWRSSVNLARDPAACDLIVGQLLVTFWSVLWLGFVRVHSGGAWLGDWLEHWQRALFFLRQWPRERLFFDLYQVPARPPLANVLTAAFLRMVGTDYPHYQVIMTALCSLAYLPVGLLAGHFGGRRAARVAALILMVNPLFMQNATYPWTKLVAVFFILTGIYFFLRMREQDPAWRRSALLCALALGAAVITHYSAGPYVVVVAAAWIVLGFRRRGAGGFVPTTLLCAGAGACVLTPWFAWSLAQYGWHGTFLSNSSVSMMQKASANPLVSMVLNLRDSLIPPQVRGFRGSLFRQASPWGTLRDQCFLLYQLNPILALGSVGSAAVGWQALRAGRAAGGRPALGWAAALAGVVALSYAAYGDRDHYGTGHLCLQSLVLLGLAFLAARWAQLGRGWRAALFIGWAVDFSLGVALQFAAEDFALDRWLRPSRSFAEVSQSYSVVSQANLGEKIIAHLAYFADILPTPPALVLALLGALFCMALVRVGRTPNESC